MKNTLSIDIDYLANLAHIHLDPSEKEIIQKDILRIIEFFSMIQKVDTTDIEFYHQEHLGETKFLTDLSKTDIDVKEYLQKNTVNEGMYIKIPPILKK